MNNTKRNLLISFGMWMVFEGIAITLWITKDNIFYLLNSIFVIVLFYIRKADKNNPICSLQYAVFFTFPPLPYKICFINIKTIILPKRYKILFSDTDYFLHERFPPFLNIYGLLYPICFLSFNRLFVLNFFSFCDGKIGKLFMIHLNFYCDGMIL